MQPEFSVNTSFTSVFNITRLIHNEFRSSACELTLDLDLIIDGKHKPGSHDATLKAQKYWVENVLNQCVAYSIYTTAPTTLFETIGNQLMFCPDEPDDFILLSLIHAKLNAIGNGCIVVSAATLHTDTSFGFNNTTVGNPLVALPDISEWMGEKRYFDQPWWNRPDGSMFDVFCEEGDDVNEKPDIFIDLISRFKEDDEEPSKTENSKSAEIIKPNFKPKLIINEHFKPDQD